ncbi:MAG: hypothetical protein JXQ72_09695 [Anaerolineae bacterium]|nr:hypothetical protein [Anaerolineae bacterium]
MGWWLHLAQYPLPAVYMLGGSPAQVAAWMSGQEVQFYGARDGALYSRLDVVPPTDVDRTSLAWRAFLETLRAPNGAYLPVVPTGDLTIYTSYDGRLRLYWARDHRLTLDVDGVQTTLARAGDALLVAVGLDRELGTVVCLDSDNRLHFYQQQVHVGAHAMPDGWDSLSAAIQVPDAGGVAYVSDSASIVAVDMAGQVLHKQALTSGGGPVGCSPDGSYLVISEQGLIRVYNAQLQPLRQAAAHDLLARAEQLQLLAEAPIPDAVPQAVAIGDDGILVFALDGIVCQSYLRELAALPQPRTLF